MPAQGCNDLDRAIGELQAAQRLDAADPRIYNNLGWFEAIRGRSDQAEAVFRQAVARGPKSAAAHVALANYLGATGRRDEAEKSLRTALEVEPKDVPSLRAIGWFLTVGNRAKEAEPFLVDAAKYDPKPDSRILLADFYVWFGRDADAVRVLEQLKSTGPGGVLADMRLAVDLLPDGPPPSREPGESRAGVASGDADAQLLSAQMAFDARKLTEAMSALQRLTTQYPRLAQAHFLKGRVLVELGRFSEAAKAFNEVVTINPRAVPARLYLARLQLLDNQATTARNIANEVLKLRPATPAARLAIVQADRVSGELADANRQDRRADPIVS